MKTVWKVFELVEVSTMDEWQGDTRSHVIMQEWFESEEFTSEFEAAKKLSGHFEDRHSSEGIGFEIKKVFI